MSTLPYNVTLSMAISSCTCRSPTPYINYIKLVKQVWIPLWLLNNTFKSISNISWRSVLFLSEATNKVYHISVSTDTMLKYNWLIDYYLTSSISAIWITRTSSTIHKNYLEMRKERRNLHNVKNSCNITSYFSKTIFLLLTMKYFLKNLTTVEIYEYYQRIIRLYMSD
jgi:hypothetical protein